MTLRPYVPSDDEAWDELVAASANGTFLLTRKYLSYHEDRFVDRSVVVVNDVGTLLAVLPAAVAPDDSSVVVSHPGVTYGGLVRDVSVRGAAVIELLEAVAVHYRELGHRRFLYKAVPHLYHRVPSQDDLYALFRLGAARYRCDLSATIDLGEPDTRSGDRRRNLAKATASGVTLDAGPQALTTFWPVLTESLAARHGVRPVHSLEEITLLSGRFPTDIRCVTASLDGEPVAGVVTYETPRVSHAQYSASSLQGRKLGALDAAYDAAIGAARARGARWFDFGISNEQGGTVLNENLFSYKSSYGAGGVVHEFYELVL
jgi:hypothetical protein